MILLASLLAFVAAAPRQRRDAIWGGYHGGGYGGHLGYAHGVAIAGPALGPASIAGPHVGSAMVAAPSIGPAKLSGSVAGPVHVSGAVAGSAVVTASVAGPAHVEGYDAGPYDGGIGEWLWNFYAQMYHAQYQKSSFYPLLSLLLNGIKRLETTLGDKL